MSKTESASSKNETNLKNETKLKTNGLLIFLAKQVPFSPEILVVLFFQF